MMAEIQAQRIAGAPRNAESKTGISRAAIQRPHSVLCRYFSVVNVPHISSGKIVAYAATRIARSKPPLASTIISTIFADICLYLLFRHSFLISKQALLLNIVFAERIPIVSAKTILRRELWNSAEGISWQA